MSFMTPMEYVTEAKHHNTAIQAVFLCLLPRLHVTQPMPFKWAYSLGNLGSIKEIQPHMNIHYNDCLKTALIWPQYCPWAYLVVCWGQAGVLVLHPGTWAAVTKDNQWVSYIILTLKVLVPTIDAQWERMGDVGSARYEPALLPPCATLRVLSYSS